MHKNFTKIAKISLILVYLVIVAGAVVRMTGSGMGCPDWPKCFGYYIPPTDISELQWDANRDFKKGQVIIVNESLQVARKDFITGTSYEPENWTPYTKHDYAVFNPLHTWTEFINRLFGALAGLGTLVMAIAALSFWKKQKSITIISWLVVFAMGFQAWLGATVVFSVLAPAKITVHMVMALVIVALILYVIHISKPSVKTIKTNTPIRFLLITALALTLIQVVFGTQVRQFIDEQSAIVGDDASHLWLANPTISFYIHRSLSIAIVLLNVFLAYRIYTNNLDFKKINWVLILLFLEIITGMSMYYFDFPFSTQALHLVLAALLFGVQFYLVLEAINSSNTVKTL
ncbi:cytochrome c oxidase assembly protein subunit 15 [Arenibacter nanhaiticus]|uniref:Cytochrome c oxidase assembly protein subunit 15 n=1 Tax=Arenibacter nanhaiticus TaxID=558155 RepID=A0A1M6BEC3_9FLAO|nr:COX15/CtaA family protein [Arenibacter nanhaiticus]SHI47100.1 cytochrome c oxidase assembly protein subunit 15 [Arenibacter nanhaiticus]